MDVKPTRQIGERIAADSEQEIEIQRREQLIHRVAEYNKRHSLDLFRLHLSDDADSYLGALRFTFLDGDQEMTKAVRLDSSASTDEVIPHLLEKFNREQGVATSYQLSVVTNGVERVLLSNERPLEVAVNSTDRQEPKFVLCPIVKRQGTPSDISHDTISLTSSISSSSALGQIHGRDSMSNVSISSDHTDRSSHLYQSPINQSVVLREKSKGKVGRSRHSVEGVMSSSGGNSKRSSVWKPFKFSRAKSTYEPKTADQLAQQHMRNMTQHGMLQVYGVGIAPKSHSQYKSVLATKSSTTIDIVKAALERYNLEKRDEDDYLLCDVIGQWNEESRPIVSPTSDSGLRGSLSPEPTPRTWITHYSRVLQLDETPMILQTLWKPGDSYERRFELRRRPPFGRHSIYDVMSTVPDHSLGSGCYQHPTSVPFLMNLRGYDQAREFLIYRLIEDVTAVGRADVQDGIGSNRHNITLTGPDILPVHCLIHQRRPECVEHQTEQEAQTWLEPMQNAHIALNGAKIDSSNSILPGDLLSIGNHHLFLFKDPSQAQEIMQGLHWEKASLSQLEDRAQSYIVDGVNSGTKPSPDMIRPQTSRKVNTGDASSLHVTGIIADAAGRQRANERLAFSYHNTDEDALIEQVVLHTDIVSVPCKLAPAYLLAMMVEYSYKHHGLKLTQELVGKLAELIQEVAWEKTRFLSEETSLKNSQVHLAVNFLLPNIQPAIFWMSNAVELMHYLCIQLPARASHHGALQSQFTLPLTLRQLLGKDVQDNMSLLEEVLQFAFQQILYPLTKVLYSVLPSLIEGSPFDSGVPNVATSRDVDSVLNVMQSVYDLMSEYCLNRGIIAQVFTNLFFFINASLVNTLMDKGAGIKFYHWVKGVQIRGSLDLFDAWALKNGLRKEFLQYTATLSTIADFLATTKEHLLQMTWRSLRKEFPSLHPAQLHHLLSDYQLPSDSSRPSHWAPSEGDCELLNDQDSLLEKFDSCPPLFIPASQFWLDLDYLPPGEGFQLFVEELQKLCVTRSATEEDVSIETQETSVLSLEQSLLDDDTVIRAGLGVTTPPTVPQLDLEDNSITSTPPLSPQSQTLSQLVEETIMQPKNVQNGDGAGDLEEECSELEMNFVIEKPNKEAEPDNVPVETEPQSLEPAAGYLHDQMVQVPSSNPAAETVLVPATCPPLLSPHTKPVNGHVTSTSPVETGMEVVSEGEEDDEGEVEMNLVFSTAVVSDESEEIPEPNINVTFEGASLRHEPLQMNGMAYVDEMVKDLESDSNSNSDDDGTDENGSESENDEDDLRYHSADTPDRDTDVVALMAKAALLLGDDSDDGMSPPPEDVSCEDQDTAKKNLPSQLKSNKGKKAGKRKRDIVATLSTVKEEVETQEDDDCEVQQSIVIVNLQPDHKGLGLGIVDGNTMPMPVPGIFISSVLPDSPAAVTRQLQIGDQILAVGNQSMTNISEQDARIILKSFEEAVNLVVAKSRGVKLKNTELAEV